MRIDRYDTGRREVAPSTLADAKARAGLTVSVCLPARDEEATIGRIVETVRRELQEAVPLVDEIVVVDDGSSDRTASVAAAAGATVHAEPDLLPEAGPGSGKGNAMWKLCFASSGDIVCFLDADVRNFGADFVTRLLTPLLDDPRVHFVKAFYRRPLHGEPDEGGRVTELMARPLLSLLFPDLTGFVQPLAGEYAGRREVLERVPFVEGWGVEVGLLVDVVARVGPEAIAQVDLGSREHRNRPLAELGPSALAILATGLRRASRVAPAPIDPVVLVRTDPTGTRHEHPVEVRERPPLASVAAYRARFPDRLTA